jgi:hypothetical protein
MVAGRGNMGLGLDESFKSPCKRNNMRSLEQKSLQSIQSFGCPFLVIMIDAVGGAWWWEETDLASDPSGPLLC